MTRDIRSLLDEARQRLAGLCDNPQLDAELLLAHVIGKNRSYFYTWPEHTPERRLVIHFEDLLERRILGEPVAHILGEREFWSLRLTITSDTLIPRPETELLVELALEAIAGITSPHILDLGTGSGAIALALAREAPQAQITATDRSVAALAVAAQNAQRHRLGNVRFAQGDWYGALEPGRRFDVIVSNPPYIPENDPHLGRGDLRHEPRTALASGPRGLDAIQTIVDGADAHLEDAGWLMVEHGYDQGAAVQALFRTAGLAEVRCLQDLAGHDRVTLGRKAPPPA